MIISKKRPQNQLSSNQVCSIASEIELPKGLQGNLVTLKEMSKMAHYRKGHPLIRQFAINIINSYDTESHNHIAEAKAIGDFVKKNFRYVKDASGIEQIHDPLTMLDQLQRGVARADCDDMALFIASLLLSIGIKPKFRCIRYKSMEGNYNHIYVVVYDNDSPYSKAQRIVLDAIVKDKPIGYELSQVSGDEFNV